MPGAEGAWESWEVVALAHPANSTTASMIGVILVVIIIFSKKKRSSDCDSTTGRTLFFLSNV